MTMAPEAGAGWIRPEWWLLQLGQEFPRLALAQRVLVGVGARPLALRALEAVLRADAGL